MSSSGSDKDTSFGQLTVATDVLESIARAGQAMWKSMWTFLIHFTGKSVVSFTYVAKEKPMLMIFFASEGEVETSSRRVPTSTWWCRDGSCLYSPSVFLLWNYLLRVPLHVLVVSQCFSGWVSSLHDSCLTTVWRCVQCGWFLLLLVFFFFFPPTPPFISLDFGSDHFDRILTFDSLTRSFAMPVGYNPISCYGSWSPLIATRRRLNLTQLWATILAQHCSALPLLPISRETFPIG